MDSVRPSRPRAGVDGRAAVEAARRRTDAVVVDAPVVAPRRTSSAALRFGVAFLVGLIAAMALGAGALYAYDQQYVGRVLPGVSVGDVDLSGPDRSRGAGRARGRLRVARRGRSW